MGLFDKVKSGRKAYQQGRNYYEGGKDAINKGKQTYQNARSVYDEGHRIYDEGQRTYKDNSDVYRGSDDLQDVAARETNPRSAYGKLKRGKLADALEDKARRLQELEDNPITYTGKDGKPRESKWNGWKKKGIIAGGVGGAGLLGGLGLFSTSLGPLQLIHMSEILRSYHMGSQEDDNNQSVFRLMKYAYYFSKGEAEKTRLGFVGNRMANRYEIYLNSVGLTSKYTRAGFFDGLAIDRSFPAYRGLNDQQVIKLLAEEGVTVKRGAEIKNSRVPAGTLVITQGDMSKRQTRRFIANKMRQGGASAFSAFVGSRVMNKRFGKVNTLLHPIKALDNKTLRFSEKVLIDFRTRLLNFVKNKGGPISATVKPSDKSTPAQQQDASAVSEDVNGTGDQGTATEQKVNSGDTEAMKSFADSLAAKRIALGAGAVSALSLPCILKALNADHSRERQVQQVIPLASNAAQQLAVGEQSQASTDTTAEQQGPWFERLSGKDARGNPASAFDADAITAITGDTPKGNPPTGALAGIMESVPFPWVEKEPVKSSLDAICSVAVQTGTLILSIITGPFSTVISAIVSGLAVNGVSSAIEAQWASHTPFNPLESGPAQGNDLGFGTLILANQNAAAHGGSPLPQNDIQQIHQEAQQARLDDFRSKSLAYRLFNPNDYRTPVARFIDQQHNGSFMSTIASAFSNVSNLGSTFGSTLLKAFTGRSYASQRTYDYAGMGTVGMGPSMMTNTELEKVADVSNRSETILESADGQKWIDQALKCKGVTIAKDSHGRWNATSNPDSAPKLEDMFAPECAQGSSATWDLISMFINYTTAANGSMCVMGSGTDAQEACVDTGFAQGAPAGGGTSTGGAAGSYKNPLRDIKGITAGRIDQGVDYGGTGPIYALGDAVVVYSGYGVWPPGDHFISYKMLDGPARDKFVYFAEECNPKVKVGDRLTADSVICDMYGVVEIGWGNDASSGNRQALAHPQYTYDGQATAYGDNFSKLLKSLGAPAGIQKSPTVNGTLPSGWPIW